MRCKACDKAIDGKDWELCNKCAYSSLDDYVVTDKGYVIPFDPTPDNIEDLIKQVGE